MYRLHPLTTMVSGYDFVKKIYIDDLGLTVRYPTWSPKMHDVNPMMWQL